MKRLLTMLLCIVLTVAMVGCGDNETNNPTDSQNPGNNGSSDNSTLQKVDPDQITYGTPFSEGYAFVNLNSDISKEYCIDKSGNILFSINVAVHGQTSGFHNGVCAFGSGLHEYTLCDVNGKLTTAADLGGTRILMDFPSTYGDDRGEYLAFCDGYIFVEKTDSSSAKKVAIFNSKLEKIVDFSEAVAELYDDFKKESYVSGYLYNSKFEVFDLNTGKLVEDVNELAKNIELDHPSDVWYYSNHKFYSLLESKQTPVIDLSQHTTLVTYVTPKFKDGEVGLVFNENGAYSFTVLLENGEFAFVPVSLAGSGAMVRCENGKYVVVSSNMMYTFTKNGKVAELNIGDMADRATILMGDDVVLVERYNNTSVTTLYYTLDLKPLFAN